MIDLFTLPKLTFVDSVLDTVGFFTRSAQLAAAIARTLYTPESTTNSCPVSIELLYPKDVFEAYPPIYKNYAEPFIRHFENFLNVKRSEFNLHGLFKEQRVAKGNTLSDYLKTVFSSQVHVRAPKADRSLDHRPYSAL